MIEVIYDVIRITAGDKTPLSVAINDEEGNRVMSGELKMVIPQLDFTSIGVFDEENEMWLFELPEVEAGKYKYHFELNGTYIHFPNYIYFVED